MYSNCLAYQHDGFCFVLFSEDSMCLLIFSSVNLMREVEYCGNLSKIYWGIWSQMLLMTSAEFQIFWFIFAFSVANIG